MFCLAAAADRLRPSVQALVDVNEQFVEFRWRGRMVSRFGGAGRFRRRCRPIVAGKPFAFLFDRFAGRRLGGSPLQTKADAEDSRDRKQPCF